MDVMSVPSGKHCREGRGGYKQTDYSHAIYFDMTDVLFCISAILDYTLDRERERESEMA